MLACHRIPMAANKKSSEGVVTGDDLKSMSIDELWKLHEAVTFEVNQKLAAEKTQLEQRLHELQGDDDASGLRPGAPTPIN